MFELRGRKEEDEEEEMGVDLRGFGYWVNV